MRTSKFHLATVKETPSDAEIVSHRLMIRSGMIRKSAAGIYSWMPLGLRVLNRVAAIVREEMQRAGAIELLMPAVQPAELWQESGRWQHYGPELLRFHDRHQREFCFGPTHEEIITDLVRNEIRSYRQLPVNFFQIQTKFRDEIRPRFGVMRAREFLMKDAYSFHLDEASLDETYAAMYRAYERIFERVGLEFRAVQADTGSIGGTASHEFHVLAQSGEDAIAFSDQSDYAANVELAPAPAPDGTRPLASEAMQSVDTPGAHTIDEVSRQLKVKPSQCLKTLLVAGADTPLVALVLRGDHELNAVKAEKQPHVAAPLRFAEASEIKQQLGCAPGSLGPVGLDIPILVDHGAASLADFVCGANRDGQHLRGVNWERDLPLPPTVDLRNVVAGDPSPDGQGRLQLRRGIEVGHIFQLGRKYSEAMQATVLDEEGRKRMVTMGCYGIGVSRVVAAAIEQSHDDRGIVWPPAIAPFQVAVLPMNMRKSEPVRKAAEDFYEQLLRAGFDPLLDDRDARPGVMFADMELIGIPHRLVVGEKALKRGCVEYKGRSADEVEEFALDEALEALAAKGIRAG